MRALTLTMSLLLLSAVACSAPSELRAEPAQSPRFEPRSIEMAFTVLPGEARTYQLDVPAGASRIDLRWSASSDVNATSVGSGGVERTWPRALGTRVTIDVPPGGGFYVFTFSNSFSVVTNKNIEIVGSVR